MSTLKTSFLIAILACVSACGRQVVEFKLGDPDGGVDGRIDARLDGPSNDGPLVDGPLVDGPLVDGPLVDGPLVDGPLVDGPLVDGPLVDGPLVDGPLVDGPLVDGPLVDAPINLPPMVMSTTPPNLAMNVSITVSPTATFNEPMNGTTINMLTFTMSQGIMMIGGTVMFDSLTNTATFDPTTDLTPGILYTATITTGAQDLGGLGLVVDYTWTFTPGAACVVPGVVLGTAGNFAVLAGSTVTNTGPSVITGDLGVYPLTAVTGFPPGTLVGTQYAGIAPSDTAQGDLTIAYNDAAGRTLCLVSITGDLGGMTLAPALYKSTGFLEITTGDLVLDAQGDPNAVWIFSMASALTVSSSRQVTIIGGGSAANVYWQVGSSAVLQTGSRFVGTIMADQSISFATGAVLTGRALARIAAVTLDTTTITRP